MGGSTNAMIHLVAIARRAASRSSSTASTSWRGGPGPGRRPPLGPVPDGGFLYAGGILALLGELRDELDLDCLTVNGRTLGQNIEEAEVYNDEVIQGLNGPVAKEAGDPVGQSRAGRCVIKPSAADPRFLRHTGPALVFESYDDMTAGIDEAELEVRPDHVLVLKNAGPVGAGMPEWGMLPLPGSC